MLIIMGTSLKVHGFKKLVKDFARTVHESAPAGGSTVSPSRTLNGKTSAKSHAGKVIFVNKTPPGAEWDGIIDYWVQGESDGWVEKVLEDWRKMVPTDWEVQQTLDSTEKGGFKAMKELNGVGGREKGKGKRKENILPEDVISLAMMTPLPPSPPPSPSKRRAAACHYASDTDGGCSPSKKRAPSRLVRNEEDPEDFTPGLLFGDATNSRLGKKLAETEDVFVAISKTERSRSKSRAVVVTKAPTKPRSGSISKPTVKTKVEVSVQRRPARATSKVR
jgi:NAD+-dependent protein deacetylase SIR2